MCTDRIPSSGWSAGPEAAERSRWRRAREGLQALKIMSGREDAASAELAGGGEDHEVEAKEPTCWEKDRTRIIIKRYKRVKNYSA